MTNDPVNHPSHYTFGRFEVIDVIEDWSLDFHLGNVVKYVARAGKKGSRAEDLRKAAWYLQRAIAAAEAAPVDPWLEPAPPLPASPTISLCSNGHPEHMHPFGEPCPVCNSDPLDRLAAEIRSTPPGEATLTLKGNPGEPLTVYRPDPYPGYADEPAEATPIPPELQRTTLHPVTQEALAKIDDPTLNQRVVEKVAAKTRAKLDGRRAPFPTAAPATIRAGEQPPEGYLTIKDAVKAYGKAEPTVYAWAAAGKIATVKVGGRKWFAPPEE